jgi:hypothetical protein
MKTGIIITLCVTACIVYLTLTIKGLNSHENLIVGLRLTSGKVLLVGDPVPDHPTFRVYQIVPAVNAGAAAYKVVCLSNDNKKSNNIYFRPGEIKDVLVLKGVSP